MGGNFPIEKFRDSQGAHQAHPIQRKFQRKSGRWYSSTTRLASIHPGWHGATVQRHETRIFTGDVFPYIYIFYTPKHIMSVKSTLYRYFKICLWVCFFCFGSILKWIFWRLVLFFWNAEAGSSSCSIKLILQWLERPLLNFHVELGQLNFILICLHCSYFFLCRCHFSAVAMFDWLPIGRAVWKSLLCGDSNWTLPGGPDGNRQNGSTCVGRINRLSMLYSLRSYWEQISCCENWIFFQVLPQLGIELPSLPQCESMKAWKLERVVEKIRPKP